MINPYLPPSCVDRPSEVHHGRATVAVLLWVLTVPIAAVVFLVLGSAIHLVVAPATGSLLLGAILGCVLGLLAAGATVKQMVFMARRTWAISRPGNRPGDRRSQPDSKRTPGPPTARA